MDDLTVGAFVVGIGIGLSIVCLIFERVGTSCEHCGRTFGHRKQCLTRARA